MLLFVCPARALRVWLRCDVPAENSLHLFPVFCAACVFFDKLALLSQKVRQTVHVVPSAGYPGVPPNRAFVGPTGEAISGCQICCTHVGEKKKNVRREECQNSKEISHLRALSSWLWLGKFSAQWKLASFRWWRTRWTVGNLWFSTEFE